MIPIVAVVVGAIVTDGGETTIEAFEPGGVGIACDVVLLNFCGTTPLLVSPRDLLRPPPMLGISPRVLPDNNKISVGFF